MTERSHVYLLQLNHNDGSIEHVAKIEESEPDSEAQLDQALEQLEERYEGRATVTVHYAKNLYTAGVLDPTVVKDWKALRKEWKSAHGS